MEPVDTAFLPHFQPLTNKFVLVFDRTQPPPTFRTLCTLRAPRLSRLLTFSLL